MRLIAMAAALAVLALGAVRAEAQESAPEFLIVWYTHFSCPEDVSDAPGSSPELAIDVEYFGEPYFTSERSDGADADDALSEFHCKYLRMTGFMRWMHYYHYRASFYSSAVAALVGDDVSYIIENFADPAARRGELLQRPVTIVGRFYDLCAAAERAQREAGQDWWLFGPCHYGANNGMMLENVTVQQVHEASPQYVLGDANRPIFAELDRVRGAERATLVRRLRDWAGLVQRGPQAFAIEELARHPDMSEEDQQEMREALLDDSYVSYLHQLSRFRTLNVRRAPVEIFWITEDEEHQRAVGCICLINSCRDRWPLIVGDAIRFLGDAACTELVKEEGEWRW